MSSPAAPPTPSAPSSLASLIAAIWAADTFDEVAEAAAEAIVAATPVGAARVRLWHAENGEQAFAAVGTWPDAPGTGTRRLARVFARRAADPEERVLRDKAGHRLGVLSTRDAIDANSSQHDVEVSEILAAQAGLAAGYIRLLHRHRRLERAHAAGRAELGVLQRAWKIALDEAPSGMCTIGLQPGDRGAFLQINDAFCDMVRSEPRELIGTPFEELVHPADRQRLMAVIRRAADGRRTPSTRDARLAPLGHEECRARITLTPVFDANRNPLFAVCHIQRLEGDHEPTPAAIAAASLHEAELLSEKIRLAAKRVDRYKTAAAMLLCDLTDLMQVEGLDTDQRQQLLASIEQHLRGVIRVDDTISHIDDHTMGVLLDDLDPVHAHTIAARVRKKLAELVAEHGGTADPSIGVTLIDHTSEPRRVLRDAATAMRQARTSASRVVLYQRAAGPAVSPPDAPVTTTGVIRNRARRGRVWPSP